MKASDSNIHWMLWGVIVLLKGDYAVGFYDFKHTTEPRCRYLPECQDDESLHSMSLVSGVA